MGIIVWVVTGLFTGVVASIVHPGRAGDETWVLDIVMGILGAVIGGMASMALGWGNVDSLELSSFFLVLACAATLVSIRAVVSGLGNRHTDSD